MPAKSFFHIDATLADISRRTVCVGYRVLVPTLAARLAPITAFANMQRPAEPCVAGHDASRRPTCVLYADSQQPGTN
jgi:hypothetical protein